MRAIGFPALELYGEGIFFTLDEDLLQRWEGNEALRERADAFAQRYVQRAGHGVPELDVDVSPRFLLCHTLAHLMIRELDAEAGYPAASLKERIYCETGKSGKEPMAGILIYVAVPDEEGSLGGLMELAKPERFLRLLNGAFEAATWCSLDPVCSEQEGHGPDLLNRAACHACALVPETSCPYGNVLLDRVFVKGAPPDVPPFRTTWGGRLMAKRRFELPGIQDLSKEQEAARALPKEKAARAAPHRRRPGNGKVRPRADLRAGRHQRERDDYLFLVFNHLLDRASGQLFGGAVSCQPDMGSLGSAACSREVARPARSAPGSRKTTGSRRLTGRASDAIVQELPAGDTPQRPYLVVDEGQDMPPEFYSTRSSASATTAFFVVADQNQQITEANSSRLGSPELPLVNRYGRGDRAQAELPKPLSDRATGTGVLHGRSGESAPGASRPGRGRGTVALRLRRGPGWTRSPGASSSSLTGTRGSSSASSPRGTR